MPWTFERQGQVGLIDIARLDGAVNRIEGAGVVAGGDEWIEWADAEWAGRAVFSQPARDVGGRDRLETREGAEPDQRACGVAQPGKARLQRLPRLVGEVARQMQSLC